MAIPSFTPPRARTPAQPSVGLLDFGPALDRAARDRARERKDILYWNAQRQYQREIGALEADPEYHGLSAAERRARRVAVADGISEALGRQDEHTAARLGAYAAEKTQAALAEVAQAEREADLKETASIYAWKTGEQQTTIAETWRGMLSSDPAEMEAAFALQQEAIEEHERLVQTLPEDQRELAQRQFDAKMAIGRLRFRYDKAVLADDPNAVLALDDQVFHHTDYIDPKAGKGARWSERVPQSERREISRAAHARKADRERTLRTSRALAKERQDRADRRRDTLAFDRLVTVNPDGSLPDAAAIQAWYLEDGGTREAFSGVTKRANDYRERRDTREDAELDASPEARGYVSWFGMHRLTADSVARVDDLEIDLGVAFDEGRISTDQYTQEKALLESQRTRLDALAKEENDAIRESRRLFRTQVIDPAKAILGITDGALFTYDADRAEQQAELLSMIPFLEERFIELGGDRAAAERIGRLVRAVLHDSIQVGAPGAPTASRAKLERAAEALHDEDLGLKTMKDWFQVAINPHEDLIQWRADGSVDVDRTLQSLRASLPRGQVDRAWASLQSDMAIGRIVLQR